MPAVADEFSLLAEEVAEFAIATPAQPRRRVSVSDPDGNAISAIEWGERPELVFLHGAGLNAHTWDATIAAVGRPAVAVDLPGHGDSHWRDDRDYRSSTNAPAVAAVLDELATGPLTVVGQSLGGTTAIALAEQRPDLVERLIVIDVSPGLRAGDAGQVTDFLAGPQVFSSREEIADTAIALGFRASRSALERGVILNTRIRDDGSVVFKHHLASLEPGQALLLQDFEALWPGLERIGVPVLLVHGTHGFLDAAVVAEFVERVPGATEVEIGTGHNVQEEAPVELAAIIDGFVSR